MSDHDFEKQVQQRLEQLKLRPSNAVWAEVERKIRLQKRRRRLLIWLPAALLVMIAGGYLVRQQLAHHDVQDLQGGAHAVVTPVTQQPTTVSPNQTPSTENSTHIHEDHQPASSPAADKPAGLIPATPGNLQATDQPVAYTPADAHQQADRSVVQHAPSLRVTTGERTGDKTTERPAVKPRRKDDIASRKPGAATTLPVTGVPVPVTPPVTADADRADKDSTVAIATPEDAGLAIAQAVPADSLQQDSVQTLAAKTADSLPATQAVAAHPVQPKKAGSRESNWQFGVNAEGGFSGVSSDGLFGFLEKDAPMADLAAAPNFTNSNAFAPQFPRPPAKASSISMGPAFSIGGFAQRKLNNRLSLSAGLQYTYLSARQAVGNKVDNYRTVNRAPATSQVVNNYYDANNTHQYTNQYHFLEIPVALHAQLNEGHRLPFGLDIGFSAARLLNTTALHYDGIGGVYYKDNSLFTKTQWTASAGFYVKLFSQSGHPLSVGPMMRYNMSPLLVKEYSTGQHLWSLGLRASVLLKK